MCVVKQAFNQTIYSHIFDIGSNVLCESACLHWAPVTPVDLKERGICMYVCCQVCCCRVFDFRML